MPTLAAIVSKAVFEPILKQLDLREGRVWPTDRYTSQVKALEALRTDGRLMLFTVRPPDEQLWLVAVLEQPKSKQGAWHAAPNVVPIRDVSALKKKLRFANGLALPTKAGVLAMSMQTPRVLDDASVALLLGGAAKVALVQSDSLPLMVHLWRETRSVRVAAVVEKLGTSRPPLTSGAGAAALAEWAAIEKAREPDDVPRLLAAFRGVPSAELARRITLMAKRDDPRVITALLALLAEPPFTSQTSKPWWSATFDALKASGDTRANEALLELSTRYRLIVDTMMGDWAASTMKVVCESFKPKGRTLKAAELEALEAQERVLFGAVKSDPRPKQLEDTTDLNALFDAIVDAPDDDAPRRVYADALLSRGDVRGEFITLQLERASGRGTPEQDNHERITFWESGKIREYALPLLSVADFSNTDEPLPADLEFERGFPSRVGLTEGTRRFATIVAAPQWSTVRTVYGLSSQPQALTVKFLESRMAKNIRELDVLPQVLLKLKAPRIYERVTMQTAAVEPWPWLPKLTSLTSSGPLRAKYFVGAPDTLHSLCLDEEGLVLASTEVLGHAKGLRSLECQATLHEPERLAGCGLEHLSISDDFRQAQRVLTAIPKLKTLTCHAYSRDEMHFKLVPKLFALNDSLQWLHLNRMVGTMNFRFVRIAKGLRLECLQPMYVGEDLVALVPSLLKLGVLQLAVQGEPSWFRWLPALKKAWPKLEVLAPSRAASAFRA